MTGLPTYLSCTGCAAVDKISGSAKEIIGTSHKGCLVQGSYGKWRITSTEQYQHRHDVFKAANCTEIWRQVIRVFCNIDEVFVERQGTRNAYKVEVMDGGLLSRDVIQAMDNLGNHRLQVVKIQSVLGDEDYQIIYVEMI